jgi:hypothetical protein
MKVAVAAPGLAASAGSFKVLVNAFDDAERVDAAALPPQVATVVAPVVEPCSMKGMGVQAFSRFPCTIAGNSVQGEFLTARFLPSLPVARLAIRIELGARQATSVGKDRWVG